MAATVSPWGKPGAWALDSEEHEDELLQEQRDDELHGRISGGEGRQAPEVSADFPSLAAAAAVVSTKAKKKKGQTLSLSEFTTYGAGKSAQPTQGKGLTHEDLMMLPTGPRQRSAEELDRGRLGGGFRSYGSNDGGRSRYGGGEDSANPRWGGSRGSEERRQGGFERDSNRELAPSRADEIDDWVAAKKSTVGNGFERRERGGFFDSQSRADESNSWVSNKSFSPSEGRRFGGGGGGFDSLRERRGGFDSASNGGGGADSDSWGRKREEVSGTANGSAGSRPKLILQPRTLPVNDGQQLGSGLVAKPKGANPFGEARPREEVLAEKGQDWKAIEEKLESVKLKEVGSPGGGQTDGPPPFGRRSFGSGNSRTSEDRTERAWRKPEPESVRFVKSAI